VRVCETPFRDAANYGGDVDVGVGLGSAGTGETEGDGLDKAIASLVLPSLSNFSSST